MSISLEKIKEPIAHEMKVFEKEFRVAMSSKIPLLERIMTYIVKRKGKQMRPMFVLLSAGVSGGINEKTYRGASLVELMHTATLIHDDVVDDAFQRRGFFSVNALWKNKIAVLVGDFLLSSGLILSLKNKEFLMLEILSEAVKAMAEGELLQLEKARKLNTNEEVYFDIITKKTASLISSCCAIGAASNDVSDEVLDRMRAFGQNVGIAFQIKDDLFDYGDGTDIGKPRGIDIQEKKLTLPLIYALQNVDEAEQKNIIKKIKGFKNRKKDLNEISAFVFDNGGIKYSVDKMHEYKNKALEILQEFPDNAYRTSLEGLVKFTIERKK
ncbi:polyprenyl synthetase family protein [bacterium]|nr:polyprenyl synthetase family protein [bacterium]